MIQFRNNLFYLSNCYPAIIKYKDKIIRTSEHFYQMCKTFDKDQQLVMMNITNPYEVKRYAKKIVIRSDWDQVKDNIMRFVVSLKFQQHEDIRSKLIHEPDSNLIEYNKWHDNYWGHCTCIKCQNKPKLNMLGNILKEVKYLFINN